jgi:hypothetical protein
VLRRGQSGEKWFYSVSNAHIAQPEMAATHPIDWLVGVRMPPGIV